MRRPVPHRTGEGELSPARPCPGSSSHRSRSRCSPDSPEVAGRRSRWRDLSTVSGEERQASGPTSRTATLPVAPGEHVPLLVGSSTSRCSRAFPGGDLRLGVRERSHHRGSEMHVAGVRTLAGRDVAQEPRNTIAYASCGVEPPRGMADNPPGPQREAPRSPRPKAR